MFDVKDVIRFHARYFLLTISVQLPLIHHELKHEEVHQQLMLKSDNLKSLQKPMPLKT